MLLRYDGHELEVPDKRILTLVGDVTEASARNIISGIIRLAREGKEPGALLINSTGGDETQVLAIMDTKRLLKLHLATLVVGKAFSSALLLLQVGDVRLATPNAVMMLHRGSVKVDEDTPSNVRAYLHRCSDPIDRKMLTMLARRTGKPRQQIAEDWLRDLYFTPRQASRYGTHGLIDGIVSG